MFCEPDLGDKGQGRQLPSRRMQDVHRDPLSRWLRIGLIEYRALQKSEAILIRSLPMDEKLIGTAVLGNAIVEWLADEVLQNSDPVNPLRRAIPAAPWCWHANSARLGAFSNTPSTLRRQRIELECAERRRCGEFPARAE